MISVSLQVLSSLKETGWYHKLLQLQSGIRAEINTKKIHTLSKRNTYVKLRKKIFTDTD
jgi:hypothetical protein